MFFVNSEWGKVPVKSWCKDIEAGAIEQIKNLARLPFIFRQVAIMPDCHQGYGMPIGGVIATKGVIIPNAVGVDIGCGMSAFNTGIKDFSIDNLKNILGKIRENIPVGMKHRDVTCSSEEMPDVAGICTDSVVMREFNSARKQLGTLGGGNHFIELQKDEEGCLWVMIHSGSRNLGKQVVEHYNKIAIALNEKYWSCVPKEWQLAFLPEDSWEAIDYLAEMKFCLEFAFKNRAKMLGEIAGFIANEFNMVVPNTMINIHHNFVAKENHFGQNVWVHRKGATQAYDEQIGIIPGSQGTHSYIVKGLGNDESFKSCSHGAGRKMSRTAAQKNLNLADEREKLDSQGILHAIRGKDDLDEAPGAYKDINEVMDSQMDLVSIVHTLTPLAVVKG